jgi:retron-type reverse transcriptase
MQRSVEDAAVALTHHVRTGWANKKATSVLAFDIAQFFPSLNHNVLSEIIKHLGLSSKVVPFFSDYLTKRKTKYAIKGEISPFYNSDVGVGQGSALSPILSALYIAPVFHLLDKWNTDEDESMYHLSLTSFLSFVDDGLLVATGDNVLDIQTALKEAYAQVTSIFTDFGLVMEHTCYDPQPYVHSASICQSIRVCVSSILVLFEPTTFVYLFS